jgi:hypothetical protein
MNYNYIDSSDDDLEGVSNLVSFEVNEEIERKVLKGK